MFEISKGIKLTICATLLLTGIFGGCTLMKTVGDLSGGTAEEQAEAADTVVKSVTAEDKQRMREEYCALPSSGRMVIRMEMLGLDIPVPEDCEKL